MNIIEELKKANEEVQKQRALVLCEVNGDKIEALKEWIGVRRRSYKQDSVAMTFGETEFV